MTIYVKIDGKSGQRSGDWVVQNGAGRGGRVISRHRTKSAAVSKARSEARKRGTNYRVQNTSGQWQQQTGYGGR